LRSAPFILGAVSMSRRSYMQTLRFDADSTLTQASDVDGDTCGRVDALVSESSVSRP
jgi:hypothetical protein